MSGVVIYITNIYYKPLPPFWHTFRQELLVARVLLDMEPSQLFPPHTAHLQVEEGEGSVQLSDPGLG